MKAFGNGDFAPGRANNRPPLFCGNNFSHWNSLMKMFIIDLDMELWYIIENGPKVPMKTNEAGLQVPKDPSEFTHTDMEMVAKNYRAMNQLYCGVNHEEF